MNIYKIYANYSKAYKRVKVYSITKFNINIIMNVS